MRADDLVVDDSKLGAGNEAAAAAVRHPMPGPILCGPILCARALYGSCLIRQVRGGGNRFVLEDIDYARDVPRVTLTRCEIARR